MKPIVLMTAYAVSPYKGSEDGTGWNFILQAARNAHIIAITRRNNRSAIEQYENESINELFKNITFFYFDLPYFMRFWKKGTIGALLYFYLWQMSMPFFILKNRIKFDIAHNLNFHNDWIPTFLWIFGKPLIWGPIGHHSVIPMSYIWEKNGWRIFIIDRIVNAIKTIVRRLDPFVYIALWRADYILAINSSVGRKYPWVSKKIYVLPAIGSKNPLSTEKSLSDKFVVFSAGRLEAIKGFDIAIQAYLEFYSKLTKTEKERVSFKIAGSGNARSMLGSIERNGIQANDKIEFIPWVSREDMNDLYRSASVFLFPSHEGAGMVVPEALAYGLPVLCFNNEGPGESTDESCAFKVSYTNYNRSVQEFSDYLLTLFRNSHRVKTMGVNAQQRFQQIFNWDRKGEFLNSLYSQITVKSYEEKYRLCSSAQ